MVATWLWLLRELQRGERRGWGQIGDGGDCESERSHKELWEFIGGDWGEIAVGSQLCAFIPFFFQKSLIFMIFLFI